MYFIPKIEWKQTQTNSTISIGSDLVSVASVSSSQIEVGMLVEGTGIPADTTVLALNSDTEIQISNNATANGTYLLDYLFRIEFEYPLKGDPIPENKNISASTKKVRSGEEFTTLHFIENEPTLRFSHIKQSIKEQVDAFVNTQYAEGREWTYFEDKTDSGTAKVVRRSRRGRRYRPKVMTRDGSGRNFKWEFSLSYRELIR